MAYQVTESDRRRFLQVCEEERLAPHPLTHEELMRVEAVTVGEYINFELIAEISGREFAEDMRARLGK